MELALVSIITAAYFIFAYSALRKDPKSHTSRLFALFSTLFGVWAITNYFSVTSLYSEEVTLFWVRVVLLVTTSLFSSLSVFAHTFPEERMTMGKKSLIIQVVLTTIISIAAISPFVMAKVDIDKDGNFIPQPGPLIPLFAGFVIYNLIRTFYFSIKKYRISNPIQKAQIRYILMGLGITFGLSVFTNMVLVNVFQNASFVAYGPLFGITFIIFTSYAIRKFQLFDLRYLLNQAIVNSILIAFLVLFFYAVYAVQSFLWGDLYKIEALLAGTFLAFVFMNIFIWFKEIITRYVDKDLLRGDYDLDEVFTTLTDTISVAVDIHDLTEEVSNTLSQKMGIEKVSFVILDSQNKENKVLASFLSKAETDLDTKIFKTIETETINKEITDEKTLLLSELEIEAKSSNVYKSFIDKKYKVIKVIPSGDNIYGILLLSNKITEKTYTERDLNFLSSISKPISLAIQRALLYLEVQQFSDKLQKEVDEATSDLRAANERLKELDSLKDDLISIAGHELRTPATVISNNLYLLEQNITSKEKRKIYIDRVKEGIRREVEMITNLLEASRFGKKKISLQPITFDLFEVLHQATDEFSYLAKEKKLTLNLVTDKDKDQIDQIQKAGFTLKAHQHFVSGETMVDADKTRVREVIDNLITNSIKYTETGWIKVWMIQDKENVEVYVKDTGVGIKPEDQDKLFQKFSRVQSKGSSGLVRPGGTGLGLYVAKNILEMHKGTLNVESKGIKGQGSVFYFILPKKFKGILNQSETSSSTE